MRLVKTESGQRVLKDRSVPLTPRQRAAFILFDGRNTVDQVLAATSPVGVTPGDIDQLLQLGLLEAPAPAPAAEEIPPPAPAPVAALPTATAERTRQQRFDEAYAIATRLTGGRGMRDFRLSLAVEQATSYEQLRSLARRIRDAVGDEAFAPLDRALND
ncbi:MAG: hypothetical protein ACXWJJ_10515 [Ramlibacter sp.]